MRTTRRTREELRRERVWPAHLELLAQVVEEVSVLAADHRRKKPRTVPRPPEAKRRRAHPDAAPAAAGPSGPGGSGPGGSAVAPAVAAMKTANAKVLRGRSVPAA